jgi:hypothetical protein
MLMTLYRSMACKFIPFNPHMYVCARSFFFHLFKAARPGKVKLDSSKISVKTRSSQTPQEAMNSPSQRQTKEKQRTYQGLVPSQLLKTTAGKSLMKASEPNKPIANVNSGQL